VLTRKKPAQKIVGAQKVLGGTPPKSTFWWIFDPLKTTIFNFFKPSKNHQKPRFWTPKKVKKNHKNTSIMVVKTFIKPKSWCYKKIISIIDAPPSRVKNKKKNTRHPS
jgi:hypothetical protein